MASTGKPKSASETAARPGMDGDSVNLHIKDEVKQGHLRNNGSALRSGSSRNQKHTTGNRYGK